FRAAAAQNDDPRLGCHGEHHARTPRADCAWARTGSERYRQAAGGGTGHSPEDFRARAASRRCAGKQVGRAGAPFARACAAALRDQSNFTPVAATTAFHLACSVVTKPANSSGVVGAATASCFAN